MLVVENITKNIVGEEIEYTYFYRILRSRITLYEGKHVIESQSYGIEIERQDKVGGNTINIERDVVKNISPQRHKVQNLLKLLYKNSVSPIHLVDIIGEYIDDYITDFDNEFEIATN